jgi:hypothetical protein
MNTTRQTALYGVMLAASGLLGVAVHADVQAVSDQHCAVMKAHQVMSDGNPVGCERLRVVTFRHHDFDGNDQRSGKVVVLDAVAQPVQAIFDALYARGFALAGARLMEDYEGDDDAAMAANNTSAFNGRKITGGTLWSIHAYGVALDINPLQNPFIGIDASGGARIVPPASARLAVNRGDNRPGKSPLPGKVEELIGLFADNGFLNWGGYWNYPIDYQHFEPGSRAFVRQLASASADEARQLFEDHIQRYRRCLADQTGVSQAVARQRCAEQGMQ